MDAVEIEAPVVAVTVYPDRARVTRRGGTRLTAGEHRIRIAPLPLRLRRDSLRIGGGGAVTVLGVEVSTWRQPRSTDGQVGELTRRARELADELAEVDDDAEVETQRRQFLTRLAERAGGTYARTLAAGDTGPTDVATFADSVAAQLAESHRRRRGLARRRTELTEDLSAVERELAAAGGKQEPDRLAAEVTVAVDADDTEVDLELSYLVDGARWESSYDLRLVEETMTVTWFGLVTQDTGEDWPECALQLSTARPAAAADVPELSPWYLDRVRRAPAPADLPAASFGAPPPPAPGAAPAGGGAVARAGAPRPAIRQAVAEVAQGVSAATYRPARPVAVPADGSAYRAVIAVLDLPVRLDHVTVPVRAAEAHLRATVRNTSAHTLLPGAAAVFHEADFVARHPAAHVGARRGDRAGPRGGRPGPGGTRADPAGRHPGHPRLHPAAGRGVPDQRGQPHPPAGDRRGPRPVAGLPRRGGGGPRVHRRPATGRAHRTRRADLAAAARPGGERPDHPGFPGRTRQGGRAGRLAGVTAAPAAVRPTGQPAGRTARQRTCHPSVVTVNTATDGWGRPCASSIATASPPVAPGPVGVTTRRTGPPSTRATVSPSRTVTAIR